LGRLLPLASRTEEIARRPLKGRNGLKNMIMQEITKSQFIDKFNQIRPDNFSYQGLSVLYDWLVEYYEEADNDYKLDVIAICCEYSEYESLEEFNKDYDRDYESIDDIRDDTTLIPIDSESFIIQQF
jgi:hypothetical protein